LVLEYSSALLSECHEITDIFVRRDHLDLRDRLCDMDEGPWIREIFRIRYIEIGTSASLPLYELRSSAWIESALISYYQYLIRHLRTRDDDVHSMLSPEALFHDIEVE
jgi:hypothetical protein